jgi:FAD/FMN-containing dehydrogenase
MSESVMTASNALLDRLRAIVGAGQVIVDPDLMEPYVVDWTRRWRGSALAVVSPESTTHTADVVRACAAVGVPIQVQGGNTGLVGGSIPATDGRAIIVSTRRLRHLDPVDELAGQVTVGAGATLAEVQRHARNAGWIYGVDLAARDSATIGGTIATNAGGIRVIAYGMSRAQVVGIEAVLADGSIIEHLTGLPKDNTGYDLSGLLTGSEGTLGVITAVRLRLHRPHPATTVAFIGVHNYAQALDLVRTSVRAGVRLLAAEIVDETGIDLAVDISDLSFPWPRRHRLGLLLEVADGGDGSGFDTQVLDDLDVVVGIDVSEQQRLWAYRELQSEAFSAHASRTAGGVAHKLDISIPLGSFAECADLLRERMLEYPPVSAFGVFGHIGDGNIHVEVSGPAADDEEVDRRVLSVVSLFGGAVSAEHGIGRAKTQWLPTCRSAAEIDAMRAIKSALDPESLFNPGVLLPYSG